MSSHEKMEHPEENIGECLPVHNIPGILMGLYYDGVITKKEQLDINCHTENERKVARVFQILRKTNSRITERILKKTGNDELLETLNSHSLKLLKRKEEMRTRNKEAYVKNPMLLDLVLSAVFKNFSLTEVKSCRFVCRQWNFVAEPFLRKLSRIEYNIASSRTSEYFSTLFSHSQTVIPFTAFRLAIVQERNNPIDVTPMEDFFRERGTHLTELTMFHCNYLGDKTSESPRNLLDQFAMNPFISIATNLTELNVINSNRYDTSTGLTQLTFSTDHLISIKKMYLINCTINFVRGCRLRATEIYLYDVTLGSADDQKLEELLINDFLDFSRAKRIKIHLWSYCNVKLMLDFGKESVKNLDSLDVHRCEILNWDKASGQINEFILSSSLFSQQPSKMKVKEMLIDDLPFVNLSSIPESVEKLSIRHADVVWSFTNSFPKLKYLQLYNNHILNLYYFKCCPQLVSVELRYRSSWSLEIKMDWLPLNIKHIWLKGNIKISGQRNLELETLILDHVMCNYFTKKFFCRCKKSFSALKHFKASKIVVSDSEYLVKTKTEFLTLPGQLIAVGPFDWDVMRFSSFSKLVDKKEEYFIFEKHKGKGIDRQTFEKFMLLN